MIDFSAIPLDHEEILPLMWSGLYFKATMALPPPDQEEKLRFVNK